MRFSRIKDPDTHKPRLREHQSPEPYGRRCTSEICPLLACACTDRVGVSCGVRWAGRACCRNGICC
eukprot:6191603-Pleurochrysis_carterae.AAC.5